MTHHYAHGIGVLVVSGEEHGQLLELLPKKRVARVLRLALEVHGTLRLWQSE
jgi:hypothetical protein